MKVELVTPEGILVSKECLSISFPSTEGMIEIMPGHEPIIIELKKGEILINQNEKIHTSEGFAVIDGKSCKILVDSAKQKI